MLGKRRRHHRARHRGGYGSGPTRALFRPVLRYVLTVETYWIDQLNSAQLLPVNPAITGRAAGASFSLLFNSYVAGQPASDISYQLPIPPWMMGCRVATGGFGCHPYSEMLAALLDDNVLTSTEGITPAFGVLSSLYSVCTQYAYVRGVGCLWSWFNETPQTVDRVVQSTTAIDFQMIDPLDKPRAKVFGFFQHTLRREDPMLTWFMEGHQYPATLPAPFEAGSHLQVDWLYRGYKAHGVPWPERRRRWVPFYNRQNTAFVNYTDPQVASDTQAANTLTANAWTLPAGGRLAPLPSISTALILQYAANNTLPSSLETMGGAGFGGFALFAPLVRRTYCAYTSPADSTTRGVTSYLSSTATMAMATPCVLKLRKQYHYLFQSRRFQPQPVIHPGYEYGDYSRHGAIPAGVVNSGSGVFPGVGEFVPDWVSAAHPDGEDFE